MKDSKRVQFTLLVAVLMLSSMTMIWLFWRFLLSTCMGTVVIMAIFLRCAHFARSFDLDVAAADRVAPLNP
jgi:hypothetical protein